MKERVLSRRQQEVVRKVGNCVVRGPDAEGSYWVVGGPNDGWRVRKDSMEAMQGNGDFLYFGKAAGVHLWRLAKSLQRSAVSGQGE